MTYKRTLVVGNKEMEYTQIQNKSVNTGDREEERGDQGFIA